MPSLSDTLESLSKRTSELAYLSTLNSKPCGPFVQAYLGLSHTSSSSSASASSSSKNVLNLIRDSSESEIRLFKFIGESSTSGSNPQNDQITGVGGGNKRVEKREYGLITPLKNLKSNKSNGKNGGNGGNGKDEVEVILRTAMKLVDDYRPMPRARAHITNLLDSHHSSQERLIELESLIEEASKPRSTQPSISTKPPSPTPNPNPNDETSSSSKPKLTPEEAIKAEEIALRALESTLIKLRKSSQANQPSSESRSYSPPPPSTRQLPSSPPISSYNNMMQTPAKSFGMSTRENIQTPGTTRQMPHVTNSLVVNGMTPRRPTNIQSTSTIDKFSPLKLLTPRTRPIGSSGLKNDNDEDQRQGGQGGRKSIFGRPSVINRVTSGSSHGSGSGSDLRQSTSITPGASSNTAPFATPFGRKTSEVPETVTKIPSAQSQDMEDETIRIPRSTSPPVLAPPVETPLTPSKSAGDDTIVQDTPKAVVTNKESNDGKLDGIDLNAEGVKAGIAKIWGTLGEMMRQGLKDGREVGEDVESSVKHLIHLSNSDLPSPPSPSSSSISSISTAPPPGGVSKPITSETILFSHLLLSILRSTSTPNGNNEGIDMNELKENLNLIANARKFDNNLNGLGTKIIYAAVGKRTVKIDRKGKSSVKFAD